MTKNPTSAAPAPKQAKPSQAMLPPRNQLISDEVELFFATQNQEVLDAKGVEFQLLNRINNRLIAENANYNLKGTRAFQTLSALSPAVIADCMLHRNRVVSIMLSDKNTDPNYDVLAVYMDHGPDTGIYVTDEVSTVRTTTRFHLKSLTM